MTIQFFAVILGGVAVVMMWRGIWGLLDEYLLPKNPRMSYLISLVVGFVLFAAMLAFLQV